MVDGLENIMCTGAHIYIVGKSRWRLPLVWFIIVGGTQTQKTQKDFKCKTLCLMKAQRVCNGTITALELHPNVTITSPQVLYNYLKVDH